MIVPLPRGDECRRRGIREARERSHFESDHVVHLLNVGIQERRDRADASIVDKQCDARIVPQRALDSGKLRLVVEVRAQHLDGPSRIGREPRR